MKNLREKLDHILNEISQDKFIENRGLGNEIGFYIFDYPPEEEMLIRNHVKMILKKLPTIKSTISPVELDLYQIMLEILKDKKILDRIEQDENKKGSDWVMRALNPVLKPKNFIDLIVDKVKGHNLAIITGVGKVWPLVRSHTILNNLHSVLDDIPVIMFFPGTYDKTELRLFGKFKDDNYYRAFKLADTI